MKLQEASKRYRLSDFNVKSLIGLIDKLYSEIKKTKKKSIYLFTTIDIKTKNGFIYPLDVYIDPKIDFSAAIGLGDEEYPTWETISLIINPKMARSRKELYNTLYHEFLHAEDPTLTTIKSPKYIEKYEDFETSPDLYYSHGIELRGITGEFFEALVNEYKERSERIKDEKDREVLLNSLDNIIGFFNELKPLSPLSYHILDEMSGDNDLDNKFRKTLSDIFLDYPQVSEFVNDTSDEEPYHLACIDMIRRYSEKGWYKFLTMLYTTSEEIRDILNNKISENQIIRLAKKILITS